MVGWWVVSLKESVNEIYNSSLRARDLVKQILTFSRQENSDLRLMKIQHIIKEVLNLIRATTPTTIDIKQDIQNDCSAIKADPTQIHQIIVILIAVEGCGLRLVEIQLLGENSRV